MKILGLLSKLSKSGAVRPLPLSSVLDIKEFAKEFGQAITDIKEQNNYKRLIKLVTYLIFGVGMLYVLAKDIATMEEIGQVMELIYSFF